MVNAADLVRLAKYLKTERDGPTASTASMGQ